MIKIFKIKTIFGENVWFYIKRIRSLVRPRTTKNHIYRLNTVTLLAACYQRVWLLEWPQTSKFSDFQVESTVFLGLRTHLTSLSNRAGELAATREIRLGRFASSSFIFRKIVHLKIQPTKRSFTKLTSTHMRRVP